jgi:hypothetical protein
MTGKLISILLIAGSVGWAQHISVGVVGGVPFTGGLSDFTTSDTLLNEVTHSYSNSNEYILGPMLEVRLPLSLAIEVDALYHPVNATSSVVVGSRVTEVTVGSSTSYATWEFPVLGKYRFALPVVSPYVEAGPSFRKTGSGLSWFSSSGFTLGGGVEVKVLRLRIAPEVRYTHWGSDSAPPVNASFFAPSNQNQAEFLVGLSF